MGTQKREEKLRNLLESVHDVCVEITNHDAQGTDDEKVIAFAQAIAQLLEEGFAMIYKSKIIIPTFRKKN